MKDKILLFVIGVLVGAVISTGAFLVYTKSTATCDTNSNNQRQMPGGNMPSMQGGQNGEPPERPEDSNMNNNLQRNGQTNNN